MTEINGDPRKERIVRGAVRFLDQFPDVEVTIRQVKGEIVFCKPTPTIYPDHLEKLGS